MRLSDLRNNFLGFAILFIGAFFDNVRGPLLPQWSTEFKLPYDKQGLLLTFGNLGALLCTFSLAPLLNRYPLRRIILCVLVLGLVFSLSSYFVYDFISLACFAAFLGIVCSLLGTLSSLHVQQSSRPQVRSKLLSLLHLMYGAGSYLAPFIVTFFILEKKPWHYNFLAAVAPLVLIYGYLTLRPNKKTVQITVTTKESYRVNGRQWLTILAMGFYVCGEVLSSMWMVSYFQNHLNFANTDSNFFQSIFFACMSITRLLCFLFLPRGWELRVMVTSVIAGIVIFCTGIWFKNPGLIALVGIIGPFFPLYIARISEKFPLQSRSMTIYVLSFMQLSLAMAHLFLGRLSAQIGIKNAFLMPPVLLVVSLILIFMGELIEFQDGRAKTVSAPDGTC